MSGVSVAREAPAREAMREIFLAMLDEGLARPDVVEAVEARFTERTVEVRILTDHAYVVLGYHPSEGYGAEAGPLFVNHHVGHYYAPIWFEFEAKGKTAKEAVRALRRVVEEEAPKVVQGIGALRRVAEEGGKLLGGMLDAAHATAAALREIKDLLGVE